LHGEPLGTGRLGPALTQGVAMQLRILDDIVLSVGTVHQLCRIIARQDPDLGKQLKRAVNSVGLNAGEGLSVRGGNRTVRIESAMASGREVIMGLRIAGAAGYLNSQQVAREVDTLDRIVATLYKLAYRPA
jgi:four helix bundle protein